MTLLLLLARPNSEFSFNFKVENIKVLPGTYDVVVSQKLLSRFTSKNRDLTYYIALEPDSTFGWWDRILFTLKECNVDLLEDSAVWWEWLSTDAAKETKSTLLNLSVHKFEPQGMTGIAMLAESHISIHTWPEKSMAVCDVFTCGEHTLPQAGVEYMKQRFESSDMIMKEFVRPLEWTSLLLTLTHGSLL